MAGSANSEIDRLADAGDKLIVAYKKPVRATTPKKSDAEKAAELERYKRERAFIRAFNDPRRQRHTLDTLFPALVEALSEMVNDATDQKKRDVARKLEAAISQLHDVIDAAEDALDDLA